MTKQIYINQYGENSVIEESELYSEITEGKNFEQLETVALDLGLDEMVVMTATIGELAYHIGKLKGMIND